MPRRMGLYPSHVTDRRPQREAGGLAASARNQSPRHKTIKYRPKKLA